MEHMLDKDVERVLFSEEELHRRVAESDRSHVVL